MKIFLRHVRDIYGPFCKPIVVVFLFIFMSQSIGLISPYLQGTLIDRVFAQKPLGSIYALIVGIFILYVIQNVLIAYLRDRYELKQLDYAIPRHASRITLDKLFSFSIGQHRRENSAFRQSVISKGQHSLSALAFTIVYEIVPMIIEVALLIFALFWMKKILGLVVFVGIFLFIGSAIWINSRIKEKVEILEDMSHEDAQFQSEVLRNAELVLANARKKMQIEECDESLSAVHEFAIRLWCRYSGIATLRNIITGLTRAAVLVIGVNLVYKNECTPGELVIFWSWSYNALARVGAVGSLQRRVTGLVAAVKKYFEILDIKPEVVMVDKPFRPELFRGKIEFRKVRFKYSQQSDNSESEEFSLNDVSFTIEAGETVAFVGESGAGKSTVVNMILRSYDPDAGQVLIDDNDLRILDLKHFRKSIGLVSQDVFIFDNTLRYNLVFGLNDRRDSITDEQLHEVSRAACIDRFYDRLDHGYDTHIGERGIRLSGGERQRVAIARALIKYPSILIFDEATSNLDPENEALIRQSIEEISKGRTTIIIAHRFSTIKNAHRIIVMDKGSIVGQGTHGELVQNCLEYQELIKRQLDILSV